MNTHWVLIAKLGEYHMEKGLHEGAVDFEAMGAGGGFTQPRDLAWV